ncbi:hypothetical protein PCANC_22445 [Puccinia coronata f. sp. avenae]|uniref:Uncharacterized protein n=1 Tax=Puccinia coronata f. sp. avenae TaxID=200324 RepID=A0A2N5U459_9BASI|nr:hypothetical protein PCANC_22445 [Puccinia coronata f. sp. avenae]
MNSVEMYGQSDWAHSIQLIARILSHSNNEQTKPIEQDSDQQHSTWNLVTKYYQARIEITYQSIHDGIDRSTNPSAIVIWWENEEKWNLSSMLEDFKSEQDTCHSRLVIVDLEPEQLEQDDEWYQICFQHGFECYSSSDLAEACMSWQCCPWPTIQRYPTTSSSSSSSRTIHPLNRIISTDHLDDMNINNHSIYDHLPSQSKHTVTNLDPLQAEGKSKNKVEEDLRFEDDFDDFVSAGTNHNSNWEEEEEEDIDTAEVEDMIKTLFGPASSGASEEDPLGDLESLFSKLDQLKLQATSMDHKDRKRLASRVALAVESHLLHSE